MVSVKVETTIAASSDEVLGLVMDIERYAEVDHKIRPVLWSRREGNRVEFACRPKIAGLRQPKVVQFAELTPGQRIDIGLLPHPANRLANSMAHFTASFECEPVHGGTRVTRRLQFTFSPAVRWLMEPLLHRRLERDVRDEIRLAKLYLEAQ
jgi:carbon monoxide dehydrogenase subunit G